MITERGNVTLESYTSASLADSESLYCHRTERGNGTIERGNGTIESQNRVTE